MLFITQLYYKVVLFLGLSSENDFIVLKNLQQAKDAISIPEKGKNWRCTIVFKGMGADTKNLLSVNRSSLLKLDTRLSQFSIVSFLYFLFWNFFKTSGVTGKVRGHYPSIKLVWSIGSPLYFPGRNKSFSLFKYQIETWPHLF